MKAKTMHKKEVQNKKAADIGFDTVFKSMQVLNYTVLFPYFDFEKEEMIRFNERITSHHNECVEYHEKFYAEVERLMKEYNFNVYELANKFPLRAKLKIIGKKFNSKGAWNVALKNANDAIMIVLVICAHELTTNWGKGADDLALYAERLLENAMNYANGMTNEFAQQYFKEYADLDYTE